jgi:cytochrome c
MAAAHQVLVAALLTFANASFADTAGMDNDSDPDPDILALDGDPAYGEYLSGECTTCHQASGEDAGIPSITGWPEEAFVLTMHAYKSGDRIHPVMQMVAERLGNEEIAALAAYFGSLAP